MNSPSSRIMTLEQSTDWHISLEKKGRKLVVTNGCFDLLHRGHVEYLYQARQTGDALLVLINSDRSVQALKGPTRPIIGENDRAYMLASLECVDAVVIFSEQRCHKAFEQIRPDIYVKGGDYTLETLDAEERKALLACNADIRFIPFIDGFSTSDIIRKIQTQQRSA